MTRSFGLPRAQEMTLGPASSIANLNASSLNVLIVKFIANGCFVNSLTFSTSSFMSLSVSLTPCVVVLASLPPCLGVNWA